jgi:regulator of nonsense transcripts 1
MAVISSNLTIFACPLDLYASKPVDVIQDHMAHGSHGMFTQAGYNDPSQDESSQIHYGMAAAGPLQSQVVVFQILNPLFSSLVAYI